MAMGSINNTRISIAQSSASGKLLAQSLAEISTRIESNPTERKRSASFCFFFGSSLLTVNVKGLALPINFE